MPRVLNAHRHIIPENAIWVDRCTQWGNPFTVGTRDELIEKYKVWLRSQPHLIAQLESLRGYDLVCWCAPMPCHADVLLELANR